MSVLRGPAVLSAVASLALGCTASPEVAPPPPPAAAGFTDVPAQLAPAAEHPARLFWDFRPADADAHRKPTFVVFNGGPGAATSSLLMAFGGGPQRVDFDTGAVAPNPASFTRLGNVLFVDERNAGFSYQFGTGDCQYDPLADAADFLRVVVEVTNARPTLRGPIYLLAESYGGMRASAMAHLLLFPDGPDAHAHHLDGVLLPWLRDRLGLAADAIPTPAQVSTLVRGQILVEPELFARVQYDEQLAYLQTRPDLTVPGQHREDVRYAKGDFELRLDFALSALATEDGFAALAGVPLTSVPRLAAPERGAAKRVQSSPRSIGETALDAKLSSRLGAVGPDDAYYLSLAPACDTRPIFSDAVTAATIRRFGESLALRTFITRAKYDATVVSDVIPIVMSKLLPARSDGKPTVVVDVTPRRGEARPGWLRFARGTTDVEVRFPTYEAGHVVTATAGQAFFDDVKDWLAE
jgi:hypothetical protein